MVTATKARRTVAARGGPRLATIIETVLIWQERSRQRRQLMTLDQRMLRDVGLDRSAAEAEYRKAPWTP